MATESTDGWRRYDRMDRRTWPPQVGKRYRVKNVTAGGDSYCAIDTWEFSHWAAFENTARYWAPWEVK